MYSFPVTLPCNDDPDLGVVATPMRFGCLLYILYNNTLTCPGHAISRRYPTCDNRRHVSLKKHKQLPNDPRLGPAQKSKLQPGGAGAYMGRIATAFHLINHLLQTQLLQLAAKHLPAHNLREHFVGSSEAGGIGTSTHPATTTATTARASISLGRPSSTHQTLPAASQRSRPPIARGPTPQRGAGSQETCKRLSRWKTLQLPTMPTPL